MQHQISRVVGPARSGEGAAKLSRPARAILKEGRKQVDYHVCPAVALKTLKIDDAPQPPLHWQYMFVHARSCASVSNEGYADPFGRLLEPFGRLVEARNASGWDKWLAVILVPGNGLAGRPISSEH